SQRATAKSDSQLLISRKVVQAEDLLDLCNERVEIVHRVAPVPQCLLNLLLERPQQVQVGLARLWLCFAAGLDGRSGLCQSVRISLTREEPRRLDELIRAHGV